MRTRRFFVLTGLLVGVLSLSVGSVAAQSVNRNAINQLNSQLLYVALPLTLFVELILVYAVVRFRNNDNPQPTTEDPALEITWTVATAIILLFVGFAAYTVLTNPYITPDQAAASSNQKLLADAPNDAVEVEVVAYQWGWHFEYHGTNVTSENKLVIPAHRQVYLRMTSKDVIHSFYVPQLGVKQDIFPHRYRAIRTKATKTGQYRAYCTEFCGAGHARMWANVSVVKPAAYQRWLHRREASAGSNSRTSGGNTGVNASSAATTR